MPKDLYVVAVGDDASQLAEFSSYFNSPLMKVIGVKPKLKALSEFTDFQKAMKDNADMQGLLLLGGSLSNGIVITNASNFNARRESPLEVIVISSNPAVVSEAEAKGYTVPKGDYRLFLNKLLYEYRRLKEA